MIFVDVDNWDYLTELVGSGDDVLHLGRINRVSDRGVEEGSITPSLREG